MHAQRSFATRQKTTLHFNKNVNARWRFMSVVFKTTLRRQEWRWSGSARGRDSDGWTARRGTSDGPKVRVEGARGNQIKITMFIRLRNRTGKVKNRNGQVVFCGLRERLSESERRVAEGPDGARGRGRARSGPRGPTACRSAAHGSPCHSPPCRPVHVPCPGTSGHYLSTSLGQLQN